MAMPGPPHASTAKTFAPDEPRLVSVSDVAEVAVELDGITLSYQRDIGRALGSAAIGLRIQRVPPGKRSSLKHRHLFQEDIILVFGRRNVAAWRLSLCCAGDGLRPLPADRWCGALFRKHRAIRPHHCRVRRSPC